MRGHRIYSSTPLTSVPLTPHPSPKPHPCLDAVNSTSVRMCFDRRRRLSLGWDTRRCWTQTTVPFCLFFWTSSAFTCRLTEFWTSAVQNVRRIPEYPQRLEAVSRGEGRGLTTNKYVECTVRTNQGHKISALDWTDRAFDRVVINVHTVSSLHYWSLLWMRGNWWQTKFWIVQCQTEGERTCSVILFRTSGTANRLKKKKNTWVFQFLFHSDFIPKMWQKKSEGQDEDADWPSVEEDVLISTCLNETFLPTRLYH